MRRADVRWVAVRPGEGAEPAAGLFAAPMPGDPFLQMSVSRFGASQLASCAHDKELQPEDCVHLHLVRSSLMTARASCTRHATISSQGLLPMKPSL